MSDYDEDFENISTDKQPVRDSNKVTKGKNDPKNVRFKLGGGINEFSKANQPAKLSSAKYEDLPANLKK